MAVLSPFYPSHMSVVLIDYFLVQHAIQHSSISRKHMVIEVAPVKDGDGVQYSLLLMYFSSLTCIVSNRREVGNYSD